ncbi:MAG: PTS transporter subunit EIIC [Micropruina sp.]
MIVGELAGAIYTWLLQRNIVVKLPDGVPPAVVNSFTALIPGTAILTLAMIVYGVFKSFNTTVFQAIYTSLQIPLQGLTDSLGGVIVICMAVPFLWFFGIHGTSLVYGVVTPMLTANATANQVIIDSGKELTIANGGRIVTQQFFDNFISMTGAGMTIGIVVYMLFRPRPPSTRPWASWPSRQPRSTSTSRSPSAPRS